MALGGKALSSFLAFLSFLMKDALFFTSYIKNNAFPQPLSKEEEAHYIGLMDDGNEDARNKLIEHNLRLVAHIVKKYDHTREMSEDLISIGTIGLIKGVESYNGEKGAKLATYAARCIENEILMYLRTLKKTNKDISLYSPIGQDQEGNEITLADIIEADTENIFELIQQAMELQKVKSYFTILNDRERDVLFYRYGLSGHEQETQKQVGKRLNISRSYVSRIEKRALMKIFRAYMRENNPS